MVTNTYSGTSVCLPMLCFFVLFFLQLFPSILLHVVSLSSKSKIICTSYTHLCRPISSHNNFCQQFDNQHKNYEQILYNAALPDLTLKRNNYSSSEIYKSSITITTTLSCSHKMLISSLNLKATTKGKEYLKLMPQQNTEHRLSPISLATHRYG